MSTTFKTSTSIVPIIRVGMYDSLLSPDFVFSSEFEDPENDGRDFDSEWSRFDGAAYKAAVGKIAKRKAEKIASERLNGKYGLKAVTSNGDILSPRYYNLETDVLSIDIEVEDGFMDVVQKNMRRWGEENGKVAAWVKERHSDRPGFWSAIPNNIPEIAAMLANDLDTDRLMGVYAEMCLVDSGYFDKDEFNESEYEQNNIDLVQSVEEELCWADFLVAQDNGKTA